MHECGVIELMPYRVKKCGFSASHSKQKQRECVVVLAFTRPQGFGNRGSRPSKKNQIADGEYIFKTHDYRHTLATRFYDDEVSIQTIRDYLGHFSEDMTKQYVDFMPKRIEKASNTYFEKPGNNLAEAITIKKRGDKK